MVKKGMYQYLCCFAVFEMMIFTSLILLPFDINYKSKLVYLEVSSTAILRFTQSAVNTKILIDFIRTFSYICTYLCDILYLKKMKIQYYFKLSDIYRGQNSLLPR